jgi:cobalt-zinc-cadmium efflux system outer membrane protein
MHKQLIRAWWWPVLVACACASYDPKPLEPEQVLAEIAAERNEAAQRPALSLEDAAKWMRQYNPQLMDAQAKHATAQGVADVPTPLPNPSLGLVPAFTDIATDQFGAGVALGWTILLGNKRKLTDDLNAVVAEEALVEVASVQRDEYLALRREFLGLAMTDRLHLAFTAIRATVGTSQRTMSRLVRAGVGTSLDVREFEWQFLESEADVAEAAEFEAEARSKLAARTGVSAIGFTIPGLPPLPEELPALASLRERLVRDHPGLARLRAEYTVAEKQLRLEVARQYPDLEIAGLYDQDQGDNRVGLVIGIELPFFDRNQPGIARAERFRDEVHTRYRSEVRRALADIDAACARLRARQARRFILEMQVLPAALSTQRLAVRGLEAGVADALRFLTILRRSKELRVSLLRAEWSVYQGWLDLESACGSPLLLFPEPPVPEDSAPEAPAQNSEPKSTNSDQEKTDES